MITPDNICITSLNNFKINLLILCICGYEDAAGVADTAAQVRALQRMGIRVSAVFMGEDSSAGAAAQIYGKNMARIRGMDQLARAAGRLIQNEIRELGD